MSEQDRWLEEEKEPLNDEAFCYAFEDLMDFYRIWIDGGCKEFAGKQVREYLKNLAESV